MSIPGSWSIRVVFFFGFVSAAGHADTVMTVRSPDNRLRVDISLPTPGSGETVRWSAAFSGKPILGESRLNLEIANEGNLLAGVRLVAAKNREADSRVQVLFGKTNFARDHYRELRLALETPRRRRLEVTFRCYHDAIAFRYAIPRQEGLASVVITDEGSSFAISGDPMAYVQYPANYRTSHEHNVVAATLRTLKMDALIDIPVTFRRPDGIHLAVTEAALRRYPGMYLMRRDSGGGAAPELIARLSPRPDGTKAICDLPMATPWRVVMVGERVGALLESNVVYLLNEPLALKDTSWVKPGKLAWSWWNGNLVDPKNPSPIFGWPAIRSYIDFCARYGIAFHSITVDEENSPWYRHAEKGIVPGPDTDPATPRAELDLKRTMDYACSKGVRLWTWVHEKSLRGRVEETLARYEKLGWSGLMVDFFDRDDQEVVEYAEQIVQAAARHHLLVHLHGVWKPTGWERTYPHLVNHEGALNLEYLKWSDQCSPEHNLLMPFTRMLAGPMDYHLGGFRAVKREQFKASWIAPQVMGSRGHHLALYVCYDNPQPMVSDYPAAYEGQAGFEFLQSVPTWWDETRVLVGEIGKMLVTARRRGEGWYIGGLRAGPACDLSLPLSFLGSGQYDLTLWRDNEETEKDPNRLTKESLRVSGRDSLNVHLGQDGGFVAQLAPSAR
ncbi:MAG: glycoside hydrolase family 97 protein [Acidobacteriota bacterium]